MTTMLSMASDVRGNNTFGLVPSDIKYGTTLTSGGGQQSVTVPMATGITNWLVIITTDPGYRVWVAYNGQTAIIPGASVAATNSELNPPPRVVTGGSTINMITPDTSVGVGVVFYAIN
jgi:hypothetical protein